MRASVTSTISKAFKRPAVTSAARSPAVLQVKSSGVGASSIKNRCGLDIVGELEFVDQLGMAEDQLHTSIAYQRQDTFSIGISYVFTGLLAAPGLFEPMRLTPPAR